MARRKPRTWQHEPGVAGRYCDRDTGADARPLPGLDPHVLRAVEVEAGICLVGTGRHQRVFLEPRDADPHGFGLPLALTGVVR